MSYRNLEPSQCRALRLPESPYAQRERGAKCGVCQDQKVLVVFPHAQILASAVLPLSASQDFILSQHMGLKNWVHL